MVIDQKKDIVKFKYVDAMRGFAILAVLAVHVGQKCENLPSFIASAANLGNFGVQLFFVASAFTLCLSLYERKSNEKMPVRNYFLRRYFRIAPMYYFGIIFYFLVRLIGKGIFPPDGYDFFSVITNFTFLHGFHPDTFNYIVPGGWSIGVEFIFYGFFPFTIKIIKNEKHALLLFLFTIMLSIAGAYFWNFIYGEIANKNSFQYYVFTTQFSNFSIGIFLFHVWRKRELILTYLKVKPEIISIISLSLFTILFVFSVNLPQIPFYHLLRPTFFSISFLFFGFALINKEWYLFVNPLTIKTGKISFSLYINHFIFAWYIAPVIMQKISSYFDVIPVWYFIHSYLITFIGGSLVSQLTYMLIEKTGMDFSKNLIIQLESGKVNLPSILINSGFIKFFRREENKE
jgi:peptidoglycan/LPS O-acetylase OafA/YrhL